MTALSRDLFLQTPLKLWPAVSIVICVFGVLLVLCLVSFHSSIRDRVWKCTGSLIKSLTEIQSGQVNATNWLPFYLTVNYSSVVSRCSLSCHLHCNEQSVTVCNIHFLAIPTDYSDNTLYEYSLWEGWAKSTTQLISFYV